MVSRIRARAAPQLSPIFIVIVAWILLKQRPSKRLFLCISIAFLGVLLVSQDAVDGNNSMFGNMLIVIATLFAATYVVLSSQIVKNFQPATLAATQQLVGLVFSLIILGIISILGIEKQNWHEISAGVLIYAGASGIVQYAMAFWFYLIGLKYLRAGTAGLWLTLIPVFGLFGAYIWLNEIPSIIMLIGGLMIMTAVWLGRNEI